mmetsp:Transcript_31882/g.28230  ORF Transcript_31882/g.28230 Transcript_31882/m.28230 type:complete len:134 (-) Transcript_31882:20-421(-)
MNFQSALMAAHIATRQLSEEGFLLFTGAAGPFEGPANWAFAYSLTKATTHSLALHMAAGKDIPEKSSVCTILPTMIDTQANREGMPEADTSEWLPTEKVGTLLRQWADGENRPQNGAFAKLSYKSGSVVPEFV